MNKKFSLIQIFRGIAAIIVVLYHIGRASNKYFHTTSLGGAFSFGHIGVDFFFVLSGFIMTYVHFKDLVNRTNKISFLKKRFIRIYPIYWIIASVQLFLLIVVMHGKTNHLDHQMDFNKPAEWLYILGNYLLISTSDSFFLGVAWTLSYEILFYLVFFVGICLGFKKAKYIALLWAILIIGKIVGSQFYPLPSLMILDVRILEFLIGGIVAYLIIKRHFIKTYAWTILFCISIGLFYFFAFPNNINEYQGVIILAVANALLIYKIVAVDMFRDRQYPKVLLLVGEASYSIYLSHVIFLSLLLRIFGAIATKFHVANYILLQCLILGVFVATVALGVCVYKLVELPLLKYCQRKFLKRKDHAG